MDHIDHSHKQEIIAGRHTAERDYWLDKLSGQLEKTCFPYDRARVGDREKPCENRLEPVTFEFPRELVSRLAHIGNKSDSRLHMILTAGLVVLMSRYTESSDIITGAPMVKQDVDAAFINTVLVLRNRLGATVTFRDLLTQVRQTFSEAAGNVNYPLESLLKRLNLPVSPGSFPLFDTALLLENIHDKAYIDFIPLNTLFSFSRRDDSIHGVLEYNPDLYRKTTAERIAAHFTYLLHQLVFNVDKPVSEIDVLSTEEKERILYEFNDTATDYPRDKTIPQLFVEQAERTGDRIALIAASATGTMSVTYRELNRESEKTARRLRAQGVKRDTVVGIMVGRSLEMAIGVLGILKAGGAYLPIDSGYPEERKQYMLADSAAEILVTTRAQGCREQAGLFLDVDSGVDSGVDPDMGPGADFDRDPRDLAYVIYTSGSTGKPKGVMVEHGNVVRLVKNTGYIDFREEDRILQTGALEFDASTFEIWGALLNGLGLCLVSNGFILDPGKLKETVRKYGIGTMWLTSPLFNRLSQEDAGIFRGLRNLLVGGDVLSPLHIGRVRRRFPGLNIVNGYGPTENTTFSTTFSIGGEYEQTIPIGGPIANSTAYIVGKSGEPVPLGVPGELIVGGDGVSRGYLNNPELTAERFNRAYRSYKTYKSYKTGDLARWLPDGGIEFLGRIDRQVKIKGFRVEPGEIRHRLLGHEYVTDAAVTARTDNDGNKYLCAYIVSNGSAPGASQLREYLSRSLPDYMLPSYFVQLEEIPLTANGKVDDHALPGPGTGVSGEEYVPPVNEIQEKLVAIWQDVLGVERIGITDNYFMVGGDSIKAVQIAARLKKYRLRLKIDDLFLYPTIEELAGHVTETQRVIDQGSVEGEVDLTPIQRWFFLENFTDGHHFNQSVLLYNETGFDRGVIERVFTAIVRHHDGLRMVYRVEGDTVTQWNRGPGVKSFDLEVFHFEEETGIAQKIEREADRIQRSFDLEKGPLVKLGLFKTSEGDHLLIVIHHLVVDGVSWRILLEDFSTGCRRSKKGEDIRFPAKTDPFKYWARRLKEYAPGMTREESDYWREIAGTPVEPLPRDRHAGGEERKNRDADTVGLALSEAETESLSKDINRAYNTETVDILLTALGLAVTGWSGNRCFAVSLEGHGRESIIEDVDINRTVGWFTSQFPVVLNMGDGEPLPRHIKNVKETLRRVPRKGIGYGILKYLAPRQGGWSFSPEPEIGFNYLGQFLQESYTRAGDRVFTASPMKMGALVSPGSEMKYALDIRGMIMDGKLTLSVVYNKYEFRRSSIEALVESYKTWLIKIMEHCRRIDDTDRTAGDFAASDLDEQEIEDIFDELEEL